jgi:hypothetical protein
MGACFLMMIGAFATPLVMAGALEYNEFADPRRAEYLGWAFAGAFGLIGYWGLQYFRAPAAKESYAHSAEMLATFRGESSSVVVTAALSVFCFWLMPVALVWREQTAMAVGPASRVTRSAMMPDLQVTGLCLHGEALVQAEIANRGPAWTSDIYTVRHSSLRVSVSRTGVRARVPGTGVSSARVPIPGSSGLVVLDRAINPDETDGARIIVEVTVDAGNTVRETNEANNTAYFPIVFEYAHPGNLPKCPELTEINGP